MLPSTTGTKWLGYHPRRLPASPALILPGRPEQRRPYPSCIHFTQGFEAICEGFRRNMGKYTKEAFSTRKTNGKHPAFRIKGADTMKYAILSDIHGNRNHLKQVLKAMKAHDIDHIFCLGDIWECKIGKSQMKGFSFAFADQIVDFDPKLVKKLHRVSCLIGNQEERIRLLLPKEETDEDLRFFLTLPPSIELKSARLEHGHHFINNKNWAPYPNRVDKHLLFFGHSHQSALYQLQWQNKQWLPKQIDIQFGVPYELDLVRYWGINVGAIVSREPEWLLYEEAVNRVTFFRESSVARESDMDA